MFISNDKRVNEVGDEIFEYLKKQSLTYDQCIDALKKAEDFCFAQIREAKSKVHKTIIK